MIIGFGAFDKKPKLIFDYEADGEQAQVTHAANIGPYLVDGGDTVVLSRSTPLSPVPEIVFGSMPNDSGHLLLSTDEREELLAREPGARRFIRPFLGSREFINGEQRWCLWLKDAAPEELRAMPEVMKRIEGVRRHRLASNRATTRELAKVPGLFGEIRQPDSRYLLIPSVSSETRPYIPIGFMDSDIIGSNLVLLVPGATLFHFGVLSSAMHMAWVRQVCGRLKSDYRYSNRLVYNNFPWPLNPSDRQQRAVSDKAQAILDVRAGFKDATLADLYGQLTMPAALLEAHRKLDRAVDACYRAQPFPNERSRLEFLFNLYEQLNAPVLPASKWSRRKSTMPRRTPALD